MRQFFLSKSLHTQLVCIGLFCVAAMATVTLAVVFVTTWNNALDGEGQVLRLRILAAMGIAGMLCLAGLYTAINRLLRPPAAAARCDVARNAKVDLIHRSDTNQPAASRDVLGLKFTFDRMLSQLHHAQDEQKQSKAVLASRTRNGRSACSSFLKAFRLRASPRTGLRHADSFSSNRFTARWGLRFWPLNRIRFPATTVRASYPLDLLQPERSDR